MGTFSLSHWLVVLAVVVVLSGARRLPTVAGDLAGGLRAFRRGLKDEPEDPASGGRPSDPS